MRYIFVYIFFATTLCVYAESFAEKIELLKGILQSKKSEIFQDIQSDFSKLKKSYTLSLESQRNYRLFFVSDGDLKFIDAELNVEDDRETITKQDKFEDIECFHWQFSTFGRSVKARLKIEQQKQGNNRNFAVILASEGFDEKGFEPTTKLTTSQGEIFEIQQGVVFRNGKTFFDEPRFKIFSLTLTPNDTVFMLSVNGDVFERKSLIYKVRDGKLPVVKMVGSLQNNIFLLRSDGVVMKNGNRVVYKASGNKKAIDLLEENNIVWIITQSGKRISLES